MQVLQIYLNEQKISQARFGKKVGVSQTMVQQWLNGKRPISIEKALDIEDAYAIDAALLNSDVPLLEKRLLIRRLAKTL